MVAFFTGLGTGLEHSSVSQLGSNGIFGSRYTGRGGDKLSVNAFNGNVLIQRQDEFLTATGLDIGVSRTYNSLALLSGSATDDNADQWRQSTDIRVYNLTGTANTTGSTVTRVSADGTEITYEYKTIDGETAYWTTEGAGTHDKLTYFAGVWTWKDGDSDITEEYISATGNGPEGYIKSRTDRSGLTVDFTYGNNNLTKITSNDGSYVEYTWSGSNITEVVTYADGGATATLTRVNYEYDVHNRLIKVTTDLTPEDNNSVSAITNGAETGIYVTQYTYNDVPSVSKRIETITQSDGSRIEFEYDSNGRVEKISQKSGVDGNGADIFREMTLFYDAAAGITTITDPSDNITKLYHNPDGELLQVVFPSPETGEDADVVQFKYLDGNIEEIINTDSFSANLNGPVVYDVSGKITSFLYDDRGNLTKKIDTNGNTDSYLYDSEDNLVRHIYTTSTALAGNQNRGIHYVYDAQGRLRFTHSAENRVTEFRYHHNTGNLTDEIRYTEHTYVHPGGLPGLSHLEGWVSGLAQSNDLETTIRTRHVYDGNGHRIRTLQYGGTDELGETVFSEGYTESRYTYDSGGRLLTSYSTDEETRSFTYDGLGRLIESTGIDGGMTRITFNDAETTTTITHSLTGTTTSIYTKTGELLQTNIAGFEDENFTNGEVSYKYDDNGWLRVETYQAHNETGGIETYNTYYLYDDAGRLTGKVDHEGYVEEFKYDDDGRQIAHARYQKRKHEADAAALQAMLQDLFDPLHALNVDDVKHNSDPVINHDPADIWSWTAYDPEGRVTQTVSGDGSVTRYLYDKSDQLVKIINYDSKLTASQLGELRDGSKEADAYVPAGSQFDNYSRTFYDSDGNVIGSLDADGYLTQIIFDSAGRKIEQISYAGLTDLAARWGQPFTVLLDGKVDANNNSAVLFKGITRSPAQDSHVRYIYDGQSHLRFTIHADGAVTEYDYGTNFRARGMVRETIQHAGLYDLTDTDFSYSNVKSNVATLGNAAENRTDWAVYSTRNQLVFSIDSVGAVTEFVYDVSGNVVKQIQYAVSRTTNGLPNVATMENWAQANSANARVSRNYYNTQNQLAYTIDAEGYITEFKYDPAGRATYNVRYGNSLNVDDTDTTSDIFSIAKGDPFAIKTVYNSRGQIEKQINQKGEVKEFSYYATGTLKNIRESTGGAFEETTTEYVYDANGRLIATHQYTEDYNNGAGAKITTSSVYDGLGNMIQQIDANGNVTNFEYDKRGNLTQLVDAEKNYTYFVYDAFGQLIRQTNATSAQNYSETLPAVQHVYNELGQRVSTTSAEGHTTHFEYSVFGELTKSISPRSAETEYIYDKASRVTKTIDALDQETDVSYTVFGEQDAVTRFNATTDYDYDDLGRLIKLTDAHGFFETYAYDSRENRIEFTNKLNAKTEYTYNVVGQLIKEEVLNVHASTSGRTTEYNYDDRGNLITKIEAAGEDYARTTSYHYDRLNRLIKTEGDPLEVYNTATQGTATTARATQIFIYDDNSNVIEQIDARGGRTVNFYDGLNRLTHSVSPEGTLSENKYNARSELKETLIYATKLVTANVTVTAPPPTGGADFRRTTFVYNDSGWMTHSRVHDVRMASFDGSLAISDENAVLETVYEHDESGNIIRTTDPNGAQTVFYYDLLGQKTHQVDQELYVTKWDYDENGNVTSEVRYATQLSTAADPAVLPNPTSAADDRITEYRYDDLGRRITETRIGVSVLAYDSGLGKYISELQNARVDFQYNALGQVTLRMEATQDLTEYEYDDQGRLILERRVSGTRIIDNDDQATITVNDFAYYNQNYDPNASEQDNEAHEVTPETEYRYDALNNLIYMRNYGKAMSTGHVVTTFSYGEGGRLESKTDPNSFVRTFRYDAAGQLIREEYVRTVPDDTVTEGRAFKYDLEGRVVEQGMVVFNDPIDPINNSNPVWHDGGDSLDTVTTTYNAFGTVESRGIEGVEIQSFVYDNAGRVEQARAMDGTTSSFLYDANGNQTVVLSSVGADLSSETLTGMMGRWGVNADGTNADNIYVNSVTDVVATITAYDDRNMAIQVIEPNREIDTTSAEYTITTSRAYNGFGDVISETNARGDTINYRYNNAGRRTHIESPAAIITHEDGSQQLVRATEQFYYDISGRLVAQRDANGEYVDDPNDPNAIATHVEHSGTLTRMELLTGSGYNGTEALVTKTIYFNGDTITTEYDRLGRARRTTDQLGRATDTIYDLAGNLRRIDRAGGMVEHFKYDGLGQLWRRGNNQFSGPHYEYRTHDAQGRIIKQVSYGGEETTYDYSWSVTGDFTATGGWIETTTHANTKTTVSHKLQTGKVVYTEDMGGNTTDFLYDDAGRLTSRTVDLVSDALLYTTSYSYFDTGQVKQISEHGSKVTDYTYDVAGNLKTEAFSVGGVSYKNASADYDALGRLTSWEELGSAQTPASTRNISYDANSNIRRSLVNYRGLDYNGDVLPQVSTNDKWFEFDRFNRVIINDGQLSGGEIVRGLGGQSIEYNEAGERVSVTSSANREVWVERGTGEVREDAPPENANTDYSGPYGEPDEDDIGEWDYYNYVHVTREMYDYDEGGRVKQINIAQSQVYVGSNTSSPYHTGPSGPGTKRSTFDYDNMGRKTDQIDYAADGVTKIFDQSLVYNTKSQVIQDEVITLRGSEYTRAAQSYFYRGEQLTWSGNTASVTGGSDAQYAMGQVTLVISHNETSSDGVNWSNTNPSSTVNSYTLYGGPVLSHTQYKPDVHDNFSSNTTYTLDSNGRATSAYVDDGRPRTVTFVHDSTGQIISRDEADNDLNKGDPRALYYRFGGKLMGEVGNNGTDNVNFKASLAMRLADDNKPWEGAFRGGSNSGISFSDFNGNYTAINSFRQGASASGYRVQSGDTLRSIAASVYGDSAMWYKIAQANGLSGDTQLAEGSDIRLPAGVSRSSHNAESFKPYNPGEILGDLNPTTPEPPNENGCGVGGQIILVAIAVAVTVALGGADGGLSVQLATGLLGTQGAVAGTAAAISTQVVAGAIAGAAGSVVSQAVGVATGIQDKFSWNAVALAAIGGGVGGGLGEALGPIGNSFSEGFIRGVTSSAITQGIGVATGLQDSFSWVGVAAAGVGGGIAADFGAEISSQFGGQESRLGQLAISTASAIANAAIRSVIEGSQFGDNLMAAIPDVIGGAIGGVVGNGLKSMAFRDPKAGSMGVNEHGVEYTVMPDGSRQYGSVIIEDPVYDANGNAIPDTFDDLDYGYAVAQQRMTEYQHSFVDGLDLWIGGANKIIDSRNRRRDVNARYARQVAQIESDVNASKIAIHNDQVAVGREEDYVESLTAQLDEIERQSHAAQRKLVSAASLVAGGIPAVAIEGGLLYDDYRNGNINNISDIPTALIGRKAGFGTRVVQRSADEILQNRGVSDAGLRSQILETGFDPRILDNISDSTLERFDKLFQGTLDAGKQFKGRLGNIKTRVATIEQAAHLESKGFDVAFEFAQDVGGRNRFVDLAAFRKDGGGLDSFYQLVNDPLPAREISAMYDLIRAQPDIPTRLIYSQGR